MADRRRVAIAGIGLVSPAGSSPEAFWDALLRCQQGASEITEWDVSGFRSHRAARAAGFDPRSAVAPAKVRRIDRASLLAIAAARQAFADAGPSWARGEAGPPSLPPDRVGVVVGSSSAGATPVREFLDPLLDQGPAGALPMVFPNTVGNAPASHVAIELGLQGPNVTVCEREASGILALHTAAGFVAEGRADAMVAGGADELPRTIYGVCDRLGVLARDAPGLPEGSHPFLAASRGFLLGEGASMLLLVPADAVPEPRRRALLAGIGVASDPVPDGRWPARSEVLARAISEALSEAEVPPCDVDLIVAAGNGVPQVEELEAAALARAFHAKIPPVTTVKRLTGELSSSGAASLLGAVLALEKQSTFPGAPPDVALRPALASRVCRQALGAVLHHVLVLSVGSGGACVAALVSRP